MMRAAFCGLLAWLLLAGNAEAQTASKASALTPAQLKDHFLIGQDLWSAASDQLVAGKVAYGDRLRVVAGRPDLILAQGAPGAWGFASEYAMVYPAGAPAARVQIRLCAAANACQNTSFQAHYRPFGAFLARDFRRVVFLEAGDVWRAEVDWLNAKVVNRKQVTNVGMLGGAKVLHWYGNSLFLRATLSSQNPIVIVDLASGAIQERPAGEIFTQGMFTNPSGSRLCAAANDQLACLDLRTGQTAHVPLPTRCGALPCSVLFGGQRQPHPTSDTDPGTFWIDDETVVSFVANVAAQVARADLRTRKAEILFAAERDESIRLRSLSPSRRFLSLMLDTKVGRNRHVRIDLRDGGVAVLPDEVVNAGMAWLDENRFLYAHQVGGLSRIGTWIHNLAKGASTRICHLPAALGTGPTQGIAYFPGRNAIYFSSGVAAGGILKADLASGQCELIVANTNNTLGRVSRIDLTPFDLRLSVTGDALWK